VSRGPLRLSREIRAAVRLTHAGRTAGTRAYLTAGMGPGRTVHTWAALRLSRTAGIWAHTSLALRIDGPCGRTHGGPHGRRGCGPYG